MKSDEIRIFARRNRDVIIAYCVLLVVLVLFAQAQADFFTRYGPQSIFNQIITLCIAALGQTLIILTAGIDLSVGTLIIFTNCVAATIMRPIIDLFGGSLLLGGAVTCVIVVLLGALCGLFNGCVVVYGRLQPIIVTLATGSIFSGLARYVRPSPGGDVPSQFARFFTGRVLEYIPMSAIVLLLALLLIWMPYRGRRYGQALYAIGGNENAAFLSGIKINAVKLLAYSIAGMCAAICGILLTAQTRSGDPTAANNFTNNSIAAAVLGGASLAGGKGSYIGTIAGAMILSLIVGLLIFWGISSYYQNLVQGIILILALSVNFFSTIIRERRNKLSALKGGATK
ncbi:MAG: ABC transporter permease [Spirochaetales bacterium]|jgi:ribose transport system permease protein|nr:ABC transporter permease [Spirochaetales bacterium]